jgi:putative hydrolase of the HAD superfamily
MSIILALDLDDTLYSEINYVHSGFAAVAIWLENKFGWPSAESVSFMKNTLENEGRGLIFNKLLREKNCYTQKLADQCIKTYRHHSPNISLDDSAFSILENCNFPLYLITDGHKVAQSRKVDSLNIKKYFKKIYITHRYGIAHSKPSLHCFQLIKKRENTSWSNIVYVGDNPEKDFVNLNKVDACTIRILKGAHKNVIARPGYDAQYTINNLTEIIQVIKNYNSLKKTKRSHS